MIDFYNSVIIEYCRDCDRHDWCTSHDEAKYAHFFHSMKKEIETELGSLKVYGNINPKNGHKRDPTLGAFEIFYRGERIFSKLKTQVWPNIGKVLDRIDRIRGGKGGHADRLAKIASRKAYTYNPAPNYNPVPKMIPIYNDHQSQPRSQTVFRPYYRDPDSSEVSLHDGYSFDKSERSFEASYYLPSIKQGSSYYQMNSDYRVNNDYRRWPKDSSRRHQSRNQSPSTLQPLKESSQEFQSFEKEHLLNFISFENNNNTQERAMKEARTVLPIINDPSVARKASMKDSAIQTEDFMSYSSNRHNEQRMIYEKKKSKREIAMQTTNGFELNTQSVVVKQEVRRRTSKSVGLGESSDKPVRQSIEKDNKNRMPSIKRIPSQTKNESEIANKGELEGKSEGMSESKVDDKSTEGGQSQALINTEHGITKVNPPQRERSREGASRSVRVRKNSEKDATNKMEASFLDNDSQPDLKESSKIVEVEGQANKQEEPASKETVVQKSRDHLENKFELKETPEPPAHKDIGSEDVNVTAHFIREEKADQSSLKSLREEPEKDSKVQDAPQKETMQDIAAVMIVPDKEHNSLEAASKNDKSGELEKLIDKLNEEEEPTKIEKEGAGSAYNIIKSPISETENPNTLTPKTALEEGNIEGEIPSENKKLDQEVLSSKKSLKEVKLIQSEKETLVKQNDLKEEVDSKTQGNSKTNLNEKDNEGLLENNRVDTEMDRVDEMESQSLSNPLISCTTTRTDLKEGLLRVPSDNTSIFGKESLLGGSKVDLFFPVKKVSQIRVPKEKGIKKKITIQGDSQEDLKLRVQTETPQILNMSSSEISLAKGSSTKVSLKFGPNKEKQLENFILFLYRNDAPWMKIIVQAQYV